MLTNMAGHEIFQSLSVQNICCKPCTCMALQQWESACVTFKQVTFETCFDRT